MPSDAMAASPISNFRTWLTSAGRRTVISSVTDGSDTLKAKTVVTAERCKVTMNTTLSRTLKVKDYVSDISEVNLTKLTDDAVAVLEDIHYNGVGLQRDRSRGRFLSKVRGVLVVAGWTDAQARAHITQQVLPIFELNINASGDYE